MEKMVKKIEINTIDHKGLGIHYHIWKDGRQSKEAYKLISEMKELLKAVRNFDKS